MFLPSASGVRSMQASWVVAEVLGGSVDPESVVKMWVNGMQSSAEDLDQGT